MPPVNGIVAERLGSALQKLLQRFESAQYLQSPSFRRAFFCLLPDKMAKKKPLKAALMYLIGNYSAFVNDFDITFPLSENLMKYNPLSKSLMFKVVSLLL